MCGVEFGAWNLHLSRTCQIRHPLSRLISTQELWENKQGNHHACTRTPLPHFSFPPRIFIYNNTAMVIKERMKKMVASACVVFWWKWRHTSFVRRTLARDRASSVEHHTMRQTLHPHQLWAEAEEILALSEKKNKKKYCLPGQSLCRPSLLLLWLLLFLFCCCCFASFFFFLLCRALIYTPGLQAADGESSERPLGGEDWRQNISSF